MTYKRKLIEVALPLEAINKESAREKSIRHGHPSTLHLWWARRPLAACRAVLFSSLVDDPSAHPDKFPTDEDQERERKRLFAIIEELVKWENSNDERVLAAAKAEIMRSTDGNPPPVLDPFCGGGSIPLEAQRLGLEAHASDLNPVAVLITKALIEIPPKFAGRSPVNPDAQSRLGTATWRGAQGLAEDIRYYGKWMRDEAERRIGHLYPKVKLPQEYGGGKATVIAWLWARTVKCPNPACGARMPLVRSFWLSTKKSKKSWVEPVIDHTNKSVRFEVGTGEGQPMDGTVNRQGARCIVCASPVPFTHVRAEGQAGRMDAQLMAIVAEGSRRRVYISPDPGHVTIANNAKPEWVPETQLLGKAAVNVPLYGLRTHADLFTPRQLVALTTFSDLVSEARDQVLKDAAAAGLPDDDKPLSEGGTNAIAYADAIAIYLALAVSRTADYSSTICTWASNPQMEIIRGTFARQALPMTWDFAEANVFGPSSGSLSILLGWVIKSVKRLPADGTATSRQRDANAELQVKSRLMTMTDPPYYDNIGYSDISDFFYVWIRSSLRNLVTDLFNTVLTPKQQELIATPYRFEGDRRAAEDFFERGLRVSFDRMRDQQDPAYPLTLFYAFRQSETKTQDSISSITASTGWETMLQSLLSSGLSIAGTWPMRTERSGRSAAIGTNALASSILLVCRPRASTAPLATRKEFLTGLRRELPNALRDLQHGNIAPVDLAQAAIGPGMAVFSRYSKVVEADGSAMRVRTALELINQVLSEVLTEQEDEYDSPTRWAIAWFEQFGLKEGSFGQADVLARAKGAAVNGLVQDGFVHASGGKVRLLRPDELLDNWDPRTDSRVRVWEVAHYLVRALEAEGEQGAASVLQKIGSLGDIARDLAYRLYVTCERKKWAQEALGYNALVVAWPEIQRLAGREPTTEEQVRLSI